jgi:acetyl esterase/lipase
MNSSSVPARPEGVSPRLRHWLPAALLLAAVAVPVASAQTPQTPPPGRGGAAGGGVEPVVLRLWEGDAPDARGTAAGDVPTLTYYAPGRGNSGTAVVLAPGGGYGNLALNHEGRQVANWFNAQGVATFVLRYRLGPTYRHPVPLNDALRAVQLVRARAKEFGLQPDRIGLMGFSAGGHLASTVATRFGQENATATDPIDRVSSRPDFVILGYPVIVSAEPYAHPGSFRNLIGDEAPADLRASLSNDAQVTANTPPTFLFHTNADTAVPPENSVMFYLALRRAGVPAEMHIFEPGPHGVGLAMNDPVLAAWPPLLSNWLRAHGWLNAP